MVLQKKRQNQKETSEKEEGNFSFEIYQEAIWGCGKTAA